MNLDRVRTAVALALSLCLYACGPSAGTPIAGAGQQQSQPSVTAEGQDLPPSATPETRPDATAAPHHSDVDLTHLTLGNGMVSTAPQRGYVWSCMTQFNAGGAQAAAAWLNGDGTWDLTRKFAVDGAVEWPHEFTKTIEDGRRVFQSNDLPDHVTGVFPISRGDDAYQVDRNPNSIQSQSVRLALPADPVLAPQPTCVGGEVGIMLSGVLIFNAFDAAGRDAPANEVQDSCQGHPQQAGLYHYHSLSGCIQDTTAGHSALMGYAFDGFGIHGYYGEDGAELTNADLDDCHGHSHAIEWDGRIVEMYHYHATHEFPYVVGCFRGTSAIRGPIGGQPGQDAQVQPDQPGQAGQGGGQPPQEAITACVGLTANAACSINTPNGLAVGTCQLPPQAAQLVCVPAGGGPPP